MLSFQLGPLALPLAPVLLAAALLAVSWLASRLAAPAWREAASHQIFVAALLGLLAARLVYVGLHAQAYMAEPLAAFDVRDGGWNAPAGILAAVAWLVRCAWRAAPLRRPLAAAAVCGLLAWGATMLIEKMRESASLPAIELTDLASGKTIGLHEAASRRPLVVNLWASWCGPCRSEMPTLAAAQAREGAVAFLFVNQGESAATVNAFLEREQLELAGVLLDPGSRLGPAVGSRALPTTLFYDASGRLVDVHIGLLNAAALNSRLGALRPG